jgi:hypothetical protein
VNNQFARFERLVERLVEGSLARLFVGQLHPLELVAQLARVMEDSAVGNQAPDRYQICLNPADYDVLLDAEPDLAQLLAAQITGQARQAELELARHPVVELLMQPDLARQSVRIVATMTSQQASQTQTLDGARLREATGREPDGSTYLIIDGKRHITLIRPVYTVGRRLDCDVVLSDPSVSRRHAQLRWRFGRYVLYDLGSSVGTLVNGHPVAEAVLEPGDVLSLGGVDIIYGSDSPTGARRSDGGTTRGWTRPGKSVKPL